MWQKLKMCIVYQSKRNTGQSVSWSEITLHNYLVLRYLAVVIMAPEDQTCFVPVGENKFNWWKTDDRQQIRQFKVM